MKRILFALPHPWYVENYFEYIIAGLGHKYYFDMDYARKHAYDFTRHIYREVDELFLFDEYFHKDPDDYDLIVPLLTTHSHLKDDQYKHKMAKVMWEPGERQWDKAVIAAATTPLAYKETPSRIPMMEVRMGVDTNLFYPNPINREDDLLRVGFVGKAHNPKRMFADVIMPLIDIPGTKFLFFIQSRLNKKEIDYCGGLPFMDRLVGGRRQWTGMPNIYNQLDILLRVDADPGMSFPVLEAAACGVPSITFNNGIDHIFADVGGAIMLDKKTPKWYYKNPDKISEMIRKSIIYLRDHPEVRKKMGESARREVEENWTWDKCLPGWEKFLDKALELSESKKNNTNNGK